MAISNEILRLQNAKAALKTAINAKNDSSHQIDDETLDDYAGFVDLIHDSLPLGYKELEYIESSYTQFIDTGIPLKTATDDVEVDFYVGDLSVAQSIFGARYSTTSRAYSLGITNSPQWRPSFGSTTENTGTATVGRHVAFMSHNGGTLTVDGTQIISIGNASITTPVNCHVFAIKGNGTLIYNSACRIYSFKIWRSGVLLMHLIPAQRMSDFEAGMYDKVSGTFFTNSGTGKFIVPSGQGVRLITKGISSNGTYNASDDGADGYSQVFVNAKPEVVPQSDVNFYDYDGTILYSYTASEFAELTEMPANSIHDGLTSQGWNWSLADAKAQVTAIGVCDIGQMYITDDGKTRLYCHFEDAVKHFYFGLGVNGTLLIDWGDGTTSTMTGSDRGSVTRTEHTYATGGDYVITITVSSGNFAFSGTSNYGYLFSKSDVNASNIHYPNLACLKRVELGSNVYFGNYSFCRCSNLEYVTIPSDMPSSVGTCVFYLCYNLKHITIPTKSSSPITSLTNYMFYYAYSLQSISLPKTITTINNSLFYNACALKRFVMPSTITSVGSSLLYANYSVNHVYISTSLTEIKTTDFYRCYSLCKLVVPASVTSIATKAFQDCYGMREYHFKSTTPPTLDNADAFTNIQSDCVIYVPSASLTAYQGATNWSTYASQMVGE